MSAREWNAYKAAARGHLARRYHLGTGTPADAAAPGVCLVKNDTGSDLTDAFQVLGIDTTVAIDPTSYLNTFKQGPILVGKQPDIDDHFGRFVVTLEPIKNGKLGLCQYSGLVAVQVEIDSSSHQFCDIKDATQTKLISRWHGAGRILFKDGTSGDQWCAVRLGHVTYRFSMCKALTKGEVDSTDTTYTVDNVKAMQGDSPVASASTELTVQNTFSDDIDDNAVVTITWNQEDDQWETADITCPS